MDKLIGIDFGRAKIGLAVSAGSLASPLKVIRYTDREALLKQIKNIFIDEHITKVIIGISEGEMAKESREFGNIIKEELSTEVDFVDETLTTSDVQRLSIEAGIKRKKRHEMEDAYAAALILQNYLDSLS